MKKSAIVGGNRSVISLCSIKSTALQAVNSRGLSRSVGYLCSLVLIPQTFNSWGRGNEWDQGTAHTYGIMGLNGYQEDLHASSHLFGYPDVNNYSLFLGRGFCQGIVMDILNGTLSFICNEVQLPMLHLGYWNYNMIDDY